MLQNSYMHLPLKQDTQIWKNVVFYLPVVTPGK